MTARGIDFTGLAYLAAIAIVGVVGWQLYVNRDAIKKAINPGDPDNLPNQAVSSFVSAATGGAARGGEDSLGGLLARLTESVPFIGTNAKIEAMKRGSAPATWEEKLRANGVMPIAGLQL